MTTGPDVGQHHFFVHLQKTAGTVMRQRLGAALGEPAIYPNASDGTNVYEVVVSVEHLRTRFEERCGEIEVVIGHFPLCTTSLLGTSFRTITVLRDPVERTLSYLRHHRKMTPADRHKTLEEIYDDPFRFDGFIHNHMVKMFSLTTETMTAGMLTPVTFTGGHLERAKEALIGIDAVGFQDDLDSFCVLLNERFGWNVGSRPRFANRTEPVDVDPRLRDRIVEDNAMDVALYEFASDLLRPRPDTP